MLRRHLRNRRPLLSSALARTEVVRALLPLGEAHVRRGLDVLRRFELVRVTDRLLNAAGILLPVEVRPLAAIHLATAQHLGQELRYIVTYDDRMANAARALGLRVESPS